MFFKKALGGGINPPPQMPTRSVLWVFAGTFSSLLVLSLLNELVMKRTDYLIVLGPFGALMTLQYALTAAPASQPRNSVYGMTVSLAITWLFKGALWKGLKAISYIFR